MLIIIYAQLIDEVHQFYQVNALQVFGKDIIRVFFADDLFEEEVQLEGFFIVEWEDTPAFTKGGQPAKDSP